MYIVLYLNNHNTDQDRGKKRECWVYAMHGILKSQRTMQDTHMKDECIALGDSK